MNEGVCKKCKNPIYWIETVNGKNMPVDQTKITIVTAKGETYTGYESHFSTCPYAKDFRKSR